jgi:hypothetical protein
MTDPDHDIVRTKYNVSKSSAKDFCMGVVSNRNQHRARELSHIESCRANDNLHDDADGGELIFIYWVKRVDNCKSCHSPLEPRENDD